MVYGYRALTILAAALLTSCAGTTDRVVPTGHHTYTVAIHGDIGFTPTSLVEPKAHEAADAFCEKQNKQVKLLGEREIYGDVGVYPSVELEFRCAPRN
jgi:hypothetical protein